MSSIAPEPHYEKLRMVACPACKRMAVFGPKNPYRPFCCARCKGIDFGDWASETFRVSHIGASEACADTSSADS